METEFSKTTGTTEPGLEEQARQKAQSLKEEAVDRGRRYISQRKDTAADFIRDFADAMETAAAQLDNKERKTASFYIRSASREMQRWSSSLRDYGIDSIAEQVQSFAGRHPAMLLSGAAVAGFAFTRVFRSVERTTRPPVEYTAPPSEPGTGSVEEEVFRPTQTGFGSPAEEFGPHS